MTNAAARGFAAVLVDVLNFLKIYRQRAFWIQIGATVLAVLLWTPFVSVGGDFAAGLVVNLIVSLVFLCSVVTNLVWAGLRKNYSCVVGTIIGFGLFYTAWSVVVLQLRDLVEIVSGLLKGFLVGALFGYMAFLVFAVSGLIFVPRRRRLGSESSGGGSAKSAESGKPEQAS